MKGRFKLINAGMSDLGASAAKQDMSSGGGAAAVAVSTSGSMSKAGSEHLKGTLKRHEEGKQKLADRAADNAKNTAGTSNDSAKDIGGSGAPTHSPTKEQ